MNNVWMVAARGATGLRVNLIDAASDKCWCDGYPRHAVGGASLVSASFSASLNRETVTMERKKNMTLCTS